MKKFKVPCNNCLVLPVCRLKRYNRFHTDCELVSFFLYDPELAMRSDFKERLMAVYKTVNPVRWEPNKTGLIGEVSVVACPLIKHR